MAENVAADGPVPVYNQDLKNPHLVETAVFVKPIQGDLLSRGQNTPTTSDEINVFATQLQNIMANASTGSIPTISRTFRIEGVPLLLTDQSYLIINLEPIFAQELFYVRTEDKAIPNFFNVLKSNWPKMASACIKEARCTLSNFGMSNGWPFYYNYINSLSQPGDIHDNSKYSNFDTYLEYLSTADGFAYFGKDASIHEMTEDGVTLASSRIPRQPQALTYTILAHNPKTNVFEVAWTPTNRVEIKIPLKEIMPVFNVPVIPLLSTNSANIELIITFYDPRYMFMLNKCLTPTINYNLRTITAIDNLPDGSNWITNANVANKDPQGQPFDIGDKTFIGADKWIYDHSATIPSIEILNGYEDFALIDLSAYCYLNLKVITDPVNNPLARAYMEPFLVSRDFFRAKYLDYYIFQNDVDISPGTSAQFWFRPSQLFYNLTHLALFFYDGGYVQQLSSTTNMKVIENVGQATYSLQNARAMSTKGHFVLSEQFNITDFQVGLSSSCTPLFSTPLNSSQLQQMTIDYFQKYGKANMVGSVIQNRLRMAQGDAFYVVDLTHTRGGGYFVDADNMINIQGTLNWIIPVGPRHTSTDGFNIVLDKSSRRKLSVICVLFYTNNFEILLDQGGSVLVSQV